MSFLQKDAVCGTKIVRWTYGKETWPPDRRQATRGPAVVAISGWAIKASELGKPNLFMNLSTYVNTKFLFVDTNNDVIRFPRCEIKSRFTRRLAILLPWRTIWSASWNLSIPRDTPE